MAAKSNKQVRDWTYTAASRTLPYIKLILRDLREGFIQIWHLYRLAGGDLNHPDYRERFRVLGEAGKAALEELDRLGVIPYQSPLRGIALYSCVVRNDQGSRQEAYFVFKDTRDGIDTYILADDLGDSGDLYGDEKPIPAAWKEAGAVPKQEQEARP